MVAEAVAETEVTSPEVEALTTPNPETESPPETNEAEVELDSILAGLTEETATEDGKGASTDGLVPPSAEKPLTPEEAKEQGRRERDAEIAQREDSVARQNYINGLNNVVQDVPKQLTAIAEKYGFSPADTTELFTQFNRLNGAYKPLYEHNASQRDPQVKSAAYNEAAAFTFDVISKAVKEDLGDVAFKTLSETKHETWADVAKTIAKEARKGLVPKEDVTKAQKAVLAKLDTALKDRGLSLKQLTGSTGPLTPAATGGSDMTYDRFLRLPEPQKATWSAANPDKFAQFLGIGTKKGN